MRRPSSPRSESTFTSSYSGSSGSSAEQSRYRQRSESTRSVTSTISDDEASGSEDEGVEYVRVNYSPRSMSGHPVVVPAPYRKCAEELARFSPRGVDVWAVPDVSDVVEIDYVVGGPHRVRHRVRGEERNDRCVENSSPVRHLPRTSGSSSAMISQKHADPTVLRNPASPRYLLSPPSHTRVPPIADDIKESARADDVGVLRTPTGRVHRADKSHRRRRVVGEVVRNVNDDDGWRRQEAGGDKSSSKVIVHRGALESPRSHSVTIAPGTPPLAPAAPRIVQYKNSVTSPPADTSRNQSPKLSRRVEAASSVHRKTLLGQQLEPGSDEENGQGMPSHKVSTGISSAPKAQPKVARPPWDSTVKPSSATGSPLDRTPPPQRSSPSRQSSSKSFADSIAAYVNGSAGVLSNPQAAGRTASARTWSDFGDEQETPDNGSAKPGKKHHQTTTSVPSVASSERNRSRFSEIESIALGPSVADAAVQTPDGLRRLGGRSRSEDPTPLESTPKPLAYSPPKRNPTGPSSSPRFTGSPAGGREGSRGSIRASSPANELSSADRGIAKKCVRCIVWGNYLPPTEFRTRLGVTLTEARQIYESLLINDAWARLGGPSDPITKPQMLIHNCMNEVVLGACNSDWKKWFSNISLRRVEDTFTRVAKHQSAIGKMLERSKNGTLLQFPVGRSPHKRRD